MKIDALSLPSIALNVLRAEVRSSWWAWMLGTGRPRVFWARGGAVLRDPQSLPPDRDAALFPTKPLRRMKLDEQTAQDVSYRMRMWHRKNRLKRGRLKLRFTP